MPVILLSARTRKEARTERISAFVAPEVLVAVRYRRRAAAGCAGEGREGDRWAVLQLGRQELNYGSGRLVSVREGPNVRQRFDAARVKTHVGAWRIDACTARPDLDKPGFFDNIPDHRTSFWGIDATRPWLRRVSFDSYCLGLDRKSFTYNRGTAQEKRHSVGARLWRPPATNESDWDYDYEGVWQIETDSPATLEAVLGGMFIEGHTRGFRICDGLPR